MAFLSEEELIRWIKRKQKLASDFLITGIGDDCAVCRPSTDEDLVITTDLLVEERHFRLDTSRPEDIGWKVGAANLSDIAAMGAVPAVFFLAAAFPPKRQALFQRMMAGLQEILQQFATPLAGGDLSAAALFFFCATVVGRVQRQKALRRDGARPGDVIYITGEPGYSGAGLRLLQSGFRLDETGRVVAPPDRPMHQAANDLIKACLLKHLRPVPRLPAGRLLARTGGITAAIDTSDGLAKDLCQICVNSGAGARLHHEALSMLTRHQWVTMDDIWGGGEDFELLFTVCPTAEQRLLAEWTAHVDLPELHRIGEICTEHPGEIRILRDGREEKPSRYGYDHFRRDSGTKPEKHG
jgi:thiamine-monophosphate kinase